MPAFRDVIDVPLVVRRLHRSRKEVLVSKSSCEVLQLLDLAGVYMFTVFLDIGEEGTRN